MKDFVTEAEAKEIVCPKLKGSVPLESFMNQLTGDRYCLGSKCMAWRWSHKASGPTDLPTGYCGAFGMPNLRGG